MTCERFTELLPDFLTGTLGTAASAELQAHAATCASCHEEMAGLSAMWNRLAALPDEMPGETLRTRFYAALAGYQQELRMAYAPPRWRDDGLGAWLQRWWPRQPAVQFALAALFFVLGGLIGARLHQDNERPGELAQLRDEVRNMQQLVTISLLQQQSASERLRGVSWSYQIGSADTEVQSALLQTLNYDPNVNVRLAAVDAVARYAEAPAVRQALLDALPRQSSPLIQIALVDLMVERHEARAVESFRRLSGEKTTNQAVRQRIEWAIQQLQ